MGQNYGVSFASKLIEDGKYEEALQAATRDHERDPEDPEPLVDRALALSHLERYDDAVAELERALVLDKDSNTLETDFVDDALFSALLAQARRDANAEQGVAKLRRYLTSFPDGRHVVDVATWSGRLRGEGKDVPIVKEHE